MGFGLVLGDVRAREARYSVPNTGHHGTPARIASQNRNRRRHLGLSDDGKFDLERGDRRVELPPARSNVAGVPESTVSLVLEGCAPGNDAAGPRVRIRPLERADLSFPPAIEHDDLAQFLRNGLRAAARTLGFGFEIDESVVVGYREQPVRPVQATGTLDEDAPRTTQSATRLVDPIGGPGRRVLERHRGRVGEEPGSLSARVGRGLHRANGGRRVLRAERAAGTC